MKKNLTSLLGFTNNTQQIVNHISNLTNKKNETILNTLSKYDSAGLEFVSPEGILTGEDELKKYIGNIKNKGKKVFAKEYVKADLALEGGGAYGFAHLGVAHAFACKGIGFDRISGTSAGAIAAALLAGGYQIDLNFSTDTDERINEALTPSADNSANEILFNDFFKPFTDMPVDDAAVYELLDDSWFIKAIEKKLDDLIQKQIVDRCADIEMNFRVLEDEIKNIVFKSFDDYGFGFVLDAAIPGQASIITPRSVISSSMNTLNIALSNTVNFTRAFAVTIANDVKTKIITAIKSSIAAVILNDSREVKNYSAYGILRLLQYGGFWNGIYIRDWMEQHLQQKVNGTGELLDGSSDQGISRPSIPNNEPGNKEKYRRAVTFKDLPIDLCIITAVVGKTGQPFDSKNIRIVYFSKKTSPDYPVAEAVRRSMSLPFVFIPREIYEGYAKKDTVLKTSDYDPNDELMQPADIKKLKEPFIPDDLICLDGGFLLNLPVAVFRDRTNEIFDCYFKGDAFQKLLIISNLTGAVKSSQRPFDVPRPVMPQPLLHLTSSDINDDVISNAQHIADMVFGNHDIEVSRGMDKTVLSLLTTISTSPVGIWKDFEIDILLRLVPNSMLVETPLLDPNIDNRLNGGEFSMPKTTKKWLLKNAFDAVRLSLKETEEQMPLLSGKLKISDDIDPYLHLLQIANVNILSNIIPAKASDAVLERSKNGASPAKPGDSMFVNSPITIEKAVAANNYNLVFYPFGYMSKTYSGFGYTWIKIENNDRNINNKDSVFIKFSVNIRSKITLLLDVKPAFADTDEWIEEPWQIKGSNGIFFRAFSKKFNSGKIIIPGPRYIDNPDNQFAYAILIRPV